MNRIAVLNSEIPRGGFGRALTSAELKNIRAAGFSCGKNWIVVRAYDSPNHGIVYRPCKSGGYDNTSLYVTTK